MDEDTLGELMLKIMLERTMGEGYAVRRGVDEVAGDRIVALQKGKALTVLWMIVFRNAGAADTFAQLYTQILDKVLPGSTARKIEQRGPAVFVMIGDGAIRNHEFIPAVWKQSSIDGTAIEAYESIAPAPQAAPRQTSLQPPAAPTPASEAPRTIDVN